MTGARRIRPRVLLVLIWAALIAMAPSLGAATQAGLTDGQFLAIMDQTGFQAGDALLFLGQNPPGLEDMDLPAPGDPALKAIVYRRISADKYRIVIRGARGVFPLLFGEAFHPQWKLYPVPPPIQQPETLQRRMLAWPAAPSFASQATARDIAGMVGAGIIRDLGHNGPLGFVSRRIWRTVQNDNLDAGGPLETWSLPCISEDRHLAANGYANLWLIDPEQVRALAPQAVMDNPDGSVDVAFVLEFQQRYPRLYGIAVSLGALSATLLFLLVRALRRNKRAKAA